MERTKVKWRKIGGGNFRLGNRIIKPNEVFTASPDEIPQLFLKFLVRLEKDPEAPAIVRTKKKFEVKEVEEWDTPVKEFQAEVDEMLERSKGDSALEHVIQSMPGGWYNIQNVVTGKAINEKKLRIKDAEKMLVELNG